MPATTRSSTRCSGTSARPCVMTLSPAPKRGFSSVGRNPSAVATPSSVNAPRKSTSARSCSPTRRAASRICSRTAHRRVPERGAPGVAQLVAVAQRDQLDRPQRDDAVGQHDPVHRRGDAVEERHDPHPVAVRGQLGGDGGGLGVVGDPAGQRRPAVVAVAGVAGPHRAVADVERRATSPPPSSTATTTDGARSTPARSSRASTTVLSSSATHSGRRWATNGRPASAGASLRKLAKTTASRSGSNASTAASDVRRRIAHRPHGRPDRRHEVVRPVRSLDDDDGGVGRRPDPDARRWPRPARRAHRARAAAPPSASRTPPARRPR